MVVAVVDGSDDRDGDRGLLVAPDGTGKWLVATMAEDWWLAIGFGWIENGLNGNLWLTIGGGNDWWLVANRQLKDVVGLMVASRWAVIPIDFVWESRNASCSIVELKGRDEATNFFFVF